MTLGNIHSIRDWGYAPDYVEAMWKIMQLDEPNDIVIATGKTYTVRDFCERAFEHVGLDWKKYVKTSGEFIRPAELDWLRGDSSKAVEMIDWEPTVDFYELVERMVDNDIKLVGESL